MCKFRLHFLAALLTFGAGVLFVSFWLVKNHSFATALSETELTKDVEITLERSVCFGSCPDYKLTISGDGTVVFEGREFVKTKGTIKSKISPEKVRQIIKEFENADYFSLKDKYQTEADGCPETWTDNPTAITSITINGKSKSIIHYYGCQEKNSIYPKALTELESKIDEIVETKQWIK